MRPELLVPVHDRSVSACLRIVWAVAAQATERLDVSDIIELLCRLDPVAVAYTAADSVAAIRFGS